MAEWHGGLQHTAYGPMAWGTTAYGLWPNGIRGYSIRPMAQWHAGLQHTTYGRMVYGATAYGLWPKAWAYDHSMGL